MMAATDFVFDIADIVWFSFGCCAMASERVIVFWILLLLFFKVCVFWEKNEILVKEET